MPCILQKYFVICMMPHGDKSNYFFNTYTYCVFSPGVLIELKRMQKVLPQCSERCIVIVLLLTENSFLKSILK